MTGAVHVEARGKVQAYAVILLVADYTERHCGGGERAILEPPRFFLLHLLPREIGGWGTH
jgi:hypothetical protein